MNQLLDRVKDAKLPQVVKSCIFHYEFEFKDKYLRGGIETNGGVDNIQKEIFIQGTV